MSKRVPARSETAHNLRVAWWSYSRNIMAVQSVLRRALGVVRGSGAGGPERELTTSLRRGAAIQVVATGPS